MTSAVRARTAVLIATLALVAGLAAPASGEAKHTPRIAHNPRGAFLGVLPSRPSAAAPTPAGTASPHAIASPRVVTNVTYHGGPVQHSSAVYAIFWAPSAASFPSGYRTTIVQYFQNLAHDSFGGSNPYGSDTQYYDVSNSVKRFESYAIGFRKSITDTHAYPASGCANYKLDDGTMSTRCLTAAQIAAEVKRVVAASSLPKGLATQYFVFTPKGVASCFTKTSLSTGGCYNPLAHAGFCAFHSFSDSGSAVLLYADMAYSNITGCTSGQSPHGNAADSVINGISHEHQETMTDPLGTAWYDSAGSEIADKCAFNFGAPQGSNAFGQFNQVINTNFYWLQQIWSNRDQACVQRNPYPQPTAAFTYTPASPAHGTKVKFSSTSHSGDGTALTYRWTFPNGVVSKLAKPTFTFSTAGAKAVTLIVADTHGDQARIIRTVTVH